MMPTGVARNVGIGNCYGPEFSLMVTGTGSAQIQIAACCFAET
jgi:hypothetical protein